MAQLKRTLGLPLLTLYGLGTILGAGIYVLIGKVATTSGLYAPLAFLVAAILAGLSGYCYSGLSSRYPQSAGEVAYIQAAFNIQLLSRVIGWMVILTGIVSAATISNGFVGYLSVFMDAPRFTSISLLILALFLIAIWGVAESVIVTAIVTVIGISGLIMVLVLAGDSLGQLPQRAHELVPAIGDGAAWFGILLGAFLAFYAFIGFEDMVNMAEEVIEPKHTLPKAILAALLISTVLYALVAVVAILAMPLEALQQSQAPMSDILMHCDWIFAQQASQVIGAISLVAVINGALVQIIMGARVLYGMGRQNLAPRWLGQVNERLQTPVIATAIISVVIWLFAIALPLATLAKITSFIIIVVFLMVNLSLLVIVKREKQIPEDAMAIPLYIPILASVMCVLFLGVQIYQMLLGQTIAGH